MANECFIAFQALSVCYISFSITGLANATAILEESYQEYPSSAVFLFFKGLVSRLKVCITALCLSFEGGRERGRILHSLQMGLFPLLDPGFYDVDCGFQIPDSSYWIPVLFSGTWILDSNH